MYNNSEFIKKVADAKAQAKVDHVRVSDLRAVVVGDSYNLDVENFEVASVDGDNGFICVGELTLNKLCPRKDTLERAKAAIPTLDEKNVVKAPGRGFSAFQRWALSEPHLSDKGTATVTCVFTEEVRKSRTTGDPITNAIFVWS